VGFVPNILYYPNAQASYAVLLRLCGLNSLFVCKRFTRTGLGVPILLGYFLQNI